MSRPGWIGAAPAAPALDAQLQEIAEGTAMLAGGMALLYVLQSHVWPRFVMFAQECDPSGEPWSSNDQAALAGDCAVLLEAGLAMAAAAEREGEGERP